MAAQLDFQAFTEELRAPGEPLIAPERFAEALHLRQQDLAQLAHVHRATVADAPANAKLQQYMRDALRILSAATEINGERLRAIYWYRNVPIPEFEHLTAEQLVSAGKTDAVFSYLLSVGGGSTG
jgi:DNA-binding XRE family transcriptional regulator